VRILDLFSGIGGFSLGLERASKEFRTVAFCEQDPFCTRILNKHWPDVPVYPDIKELTYERLKADGIFPDPYWGGCEESINIGECKTGVEEKKFKRNHCDGATSNGRTEKNKGEKIKELAGAIDIVCGGFP
jgi:site-specific DNA-cytosine methylase